jgi:selenium metabolism protein YedF
MQLTHKEIDNRGLSCPQPVLNTKKALDVLFQGEHEEFTLTVIVDNEAARENVTRFAGTAGCRVTAENREDGIYVVIRNPEEKDNYKGGSQPEVKEFCSCAGGMSEGQTIFLITSSTLGQGSEELGKILMRSFMYSLQELGYLPSKMLFFNSGVFLTTEGSPVLDELNQLVEKGVEIFSCGTCLDYYQLKDKLKVGNVTNMYDTVENISSAAKCITL